MKLLNVSTFGLLKVITSATAWHSVATTRRSGHVGIIGYSPIATKVKSIAVEVGTAPQPPGAE